MERIKDKELIIFDLDGTLINSIPDLALAINMMLGHYDLPSLTVEQVTPFVGNGVTPLVRRSLEYSMKDTNVEKGNLGEAIDIYVSAYQEVTCEETYLFDGVMETLDYLKEKGYKMVICTNKPYRFVEPILEKLSIKDYFECWVGEDSLAKKKPSAVPLKYLAQEMETMIEKCVMIGDSKNDILAAQNAGMESIGVSYGYNYNENIGDHNPTMVVDDFAALKEIL